jgi:hypothetical protein
MPQDVGQLGEEFRSQNNVQSVKESSSLVVVPLDGALELEHPLALSSMEYEP